MQAFVDMKALASAPASLKQEIKSSVTKKAYAAATHVIRTGQEGEAIYYIVRGECVAQSSPGDGSFAKSSTRCS